MLTREQRDKWAEKLESAYYSKRQGRGKLVNKDRYCCLALLGLAIGVPLRVLRRGWSEYEPAEELLGSKTVNDFWNMNDHDKLTFPQIAKHVRSLPVSDEPQP